MRFLIAIVLVAFSVSAHASCVILLHGLARTSGSMNKLEKALLAENYHVVNFDYPSREETIEVLAEQVVGAALEQCGAEDRINFVTHSLGGILVRQYLTQYEIPGLDRVVMLGPPNKGSEVVDKISNVPGFDFINGKAGRQLGTGPESVPKSLGKAEFDLGIIAGARSINWIFSYIVPGQDDGTVSVENTMLQGMNDHIVLPVTHTFMMMNKEVITQTVYYLENGKFQRESSY